MQVLESGNQKEIKNFLISKLYNKTLDVSSMLNSINLRFEKLDKETFLLVKDIITDPTVLNEINSVTVINFLKLAYQYQDIESTHVMFKYLIESGYPLPTSHANMRLLTLRVEQKYKTMSTRALSNEILDAMEMLSKVSRSRIHLELENVADQKQPFKDGFNLRFRSELATKIYSQNDVKMVDILKFYITEAKKKPNSQDQIKEFLRNYFSFLTSRFFSGLPEFHFEYFLNNEFVFDCFFKEFTVVDHDQRIIHLDSEMLQELINLYPRISTMHDAASINKFLAGIFSQKESTDEYQNYTYRVSMADLYQMVSGPKKAKGGGNNRFQSTLVSLIASHNDYYELLTYMALNNLFDNRSTRQEVYYSMLKSILIRNESKVDAYSGIVRKLKTLLDCNEAPDRGEFKINLLLNGVIPILEDRFQEGMEYLLVSIAQPAARSQILATADHLMRESVRTNPQESDVTEHDMNVVYHR